MRNSFYLALVAAAATLTACSSEEPLGGDGGSGTVFTVTMPAPVQSRTFGDGAGIPANIKLHYAVFEQNATDATLIGTYSTNVDVTETFQQVDANYSLTTEIQLAKGVNYNIVFWAADDNATAYTWNPQDGTVDVDYSKMLSNSDIYDAYFGKVSVSGNASGGQSVVLQRPFAQLNVLTDDLTAPTAISAYGDADNDGMADVTTSLTVAQGELNTQLNLFSGKTSVPTTAATTFAGVPKSGQTMTIGGKSYQWLCMDYLLAPQDNPELIHATWQFGTRTSLDETNIPIRRNYQTNVFGSLLTNTSSMNVTIQPAFVNGKDPDKYPDYMVGCATSVAQLNKWLANGKKIVELETAPTELAVIQMPAAGDATVILRGFSSSHGFEIKGNGTVELENVTIQPTTALEPGLKINNEVTVKTDNATITGGANHADAINIPQGSKLTLTGKNLMLTGTGNGGTSFHSGGSGIGNANDDEVECGSIVIEDMTGLTAVGNSGHGFGIGSSACPSLAITNSTITKVVGGCPQQGFKNDLKYGSSEPEGGAAIGARNITITNSTITEAIGGSKCAAIGNRYWEPTNVTITGSTIAKAIGGNASAGIGGGRYAYGPSSTPTKVTITISNSTIYAEGGEYGAGIGSGYDTKCGENVKPGSSTTITIDGTSDITAKGGKYSAGIGTGYHAMPELLGSIASGVTVNATAGTPDVYKNGYTQAQNIGYGILDPSREGSGQTHTVNWQNPVFTVAGVAIASPTIVTWL